MAKADDALLGRITVDPDIFGGKPIVRGRRMAVEHILSYLAAGDTPEALLREFEGLEADDIRAGLLYAHEEIEPRIANQAERRDN